jgi:SAM-dependent methyltransferase
MGLLNSPCRNHAPSPGRRLLSPSHRSPGAHSERDRADRFDEGVAAYQGQFLAAATIDEAANVLDIGRGSGRTTRDAARLATAVFLRAGVADHQTAHGIHYGSAAWLIEARRR